MTAQIEQRRPSWVTIAEMCDAHALSKSDLIERLAAQWLPAK